jgi:hypothetical protein
LRGLETHFHDFVSKDNGSVHIVSLRAIDILERTFPINARTLDPNIKTNVGTRKPGDAINISLQRMTAKLGRGFHTPRRVKDRIANRVNRGAGEPSVERYVSRNPTLEPPISIERIAIVALWGKALVWTVLGAG